MDEDTLLWQLMPDLDTLNILLHTRWASNGIINIANAHPVDGRLISGELAGNLVDSADRDAFFVLNGDVDNYRELLESVVHARGLAIDPAISTDAKILPIVFLLETDADVEPAKRFAEVLRRSDGSLAVMAQHPSWPDRLFLAQKGSGQSLYAGRVANGWFVASELYGMAAICRDAHSVVSPDRDGIAVSLAAGRGTEAGPLAVSLGNGEPIQLRPEPLGIFSRDIDRKGFDYYIDKEIHEAPDGVRRTLQGKYKLVDGAPVFNLAAFGNGPALVERLRSRNQPAIQRIIAVGQGTAAIAAMGVAHLISKALESKDVVVESAKASELIGFMSERNLEGVMVIAVSQSGTTTDTNRVVDLMRKRGAWVHAIVNRRDSPLVAKAHSYLYTSDGRDVEMSVASTKAFYSQVAAGKLIALLLAKVWNTLGDEQILEEIRILEKLPAKIEDVLAEREAIASCAARLGPSSRYWALVGNGPNRIAAEEIRIKLSELCYKAIPCDFTEDKKHIDLSTEPLTIVVANDLREEVVQDTVKEVSIFRAHNGRPLVFCSRGEDRFDEVADALIKVPAIGGGLDFVLATVAGHLWGIEAAKAIDARADPFRVLRGLLSDPDESARTVGSILSAFHASLEGIQRGEGDSALPARTVADLAACVGQMEILPEDSVLAGDKLSLAVDIVRRVIDEMSRPIDTIRHQAKTVTVGISRPEPRVPAFMEPVFAALGLAASDLREDDLRLLESLAGAVFDVPGCLLYEVQVAAGDPKAVPLLRAVRGFGSSRVTDSRFAESYRARGSKRRVLRVGSASWSEGPADVESILLLPVGSTGTWGCSHIVLMHLDFAPGVAPAQKLRLLRRLGSKHADLLELKEEKSIAAPLEAILEVVSARDLVFRSTSELLRIYSES
ncbi:MAG: SIS domain-containing protein [Acidobacteria bacterium]|nr:SIS domain-containing protein [Acidobacteriota bacterium]